MRAAAQTQATDPLTGVGGYPLPPRPFNMDEWRKRWGAWYSVAAREVVRQVIPAKG